MDEALTRIVSGGYSIENSVNTALLYQKTKKINPYDLRFFEWNKVRHLHILGSWDFSEIDQLRTHPGLKPGCYLGGMETWLLMIGASGLQIQEYLARCGTALEVLTVQFTSVESLDLANLTGLQMLNLSRNDRLCRVNGMGALTELRTLQLKWSKIGPVLDLNPYYRLNTVEVSGTPICEIKLDHPQMCMREFWVDHTNIHDGEFISRLPALERLSLRALDIETLENVDFSKKLSWLDLSSTSLSRLPEGLRCLAGLRVLDISGLELEELPDWFPDLLRHNNIYMKGTTVQGMEPGFLDQPQEVILQWFEERGKASEADDGTLLNEVKVVFLGDGEAGKSHTIARLLNDGGDPKDFDGDSTPGIVITDKDYEIGDRNVQVHFWDFGGQEILHSMHRMFLTKRTLYVILINARDDTQDDRARYWLHNVKSFANGAPVLLVLNKTDQNPNACVNETDLHAIYPGLTEVVRLSAMYDDREKFNTSFTEAMKRQIGKMENLGFFFPASWTRAKQRLRDMTENYIRGSDFTVICDESGVSNEGDFRKGLLNWFNDLGVSICYGGSRQLRDYVILRPNWITNAIYAILFNKHPDTKNGIISHEAIFEMIQPPEDGADPYRRTSSEERYTQEEIEFILNVTRKFHLSFRVDDGSEEEREFIPMLCQRESLPIAADYAKDPDALEFRMTFDYLPSNVLHRLMVELRQDLDTTQVWRTGAHFEQRSSGLSAVVKSEGSVLKFYVRSAGSAHKANTYLCILKDTVDRIVSSMNLEPPFNEVVYKLDGKSQAFDYDELVESLEHGETTRYSRAHKRRLPIDDILNQTGRKPEEDRQRLLQDIVTVCGQMQANEQNWNAREDVRNTYVRDLLRAKGYHIADQTFSGISKGGRQAGEVDLMILRQPDVPWTLYEALNLSGSSNSQIRYWNDHLSRLLDNYNANGLPFLFLVSYADISKDRFFGIVKEYMEHLRFYSPDSYALQTADLTESSDIPNGYIQAARCTYDRAGFPTTVYHIFVHLGA